MADSLKFSPDILRRLGEELVPAIDQGIVELVKNAYDADATSCDIALKELTSGKGTITIVDNGTGMTGEQIRRGWLVIGRSDKTKESLTPKYNRVPVGDKGLGRLAALRLGKRVTLTTRPAAEPGKQYSLVLDWVEYEKADVVEDVKLEIKEGKTDRPQGTEIRIDDIGGRVTRGTVTKLARSLLLLSDPFARFEEPLEAREAEPGDREPASDPGFSATLLTQEFDDLQAKVSQSYFVDAEYRIQAQVDEDGSAIFRMLDWKGDILHEDPAGEVFDAPPFTFDLWAYILSKESFSTRSSSMTEVRQWLGELGGVHIYEDSIRVPPYGGADNDWLELNVRRARSPEGRPSTNTSVGRVKVTNTGGKLIQKTDRVGYVENAAFTELKRACVEALNWSARILLKERDRKREAEKQSKKEKAAKATKSLERVLSKTVKPTERKKVDNAIRNYVKQTEKEADTLREELELYRSLATAGMTSAVFAHEIGRPLKLIDNGIRGLMRLVPADDKEKAGKRVERIQASRDRLSTFVSIPLRLLSKSKRRSGKIDVNDTISDLVTMLRPVSDYYETVIEFLPSEDGLFINGTEALLDGVLLNLVLNSFNAFQREDFEQDKRQIRIETWSDTSDIVIRVEDNAGGIDGVAVEDIWLPGVTTVADGTGFGLTIVRDSIKDLHGTIHADALSEFGGASFTISLRPMRELFAR